MYKEELCAGFWVKGFKVKVDQDKTSLYLKSASSLALKNSWPQEAREMILGLGGHVGPWAAQALPLEQPFLHFNHAGKQASWPCLQMMLEEWIFMYNLLILMLATNSHAPPPHSLEEYNGTVTPTMAR